MVRAQIIALSLGAGAVVVGGVLAWQGWLPGFKSARPPEAKLAAPVSPKKPAARVAAAPAAPRQSESAAAVAAAKPAAPLPAPAVAAPAVAPQPPPTVPQFDTVRVEPSGESVVAGHAAPGAKIDLLAGDKVIGVVQAGDSGDFVIVPQALAPGNYVLSLRSHSAAVATLPSRQTITVSVPAKGQSGVVVALSEPGKASVLLADPTAQASAAATAKALATVPARPGAEVPPQAAAKAVAAAVAEPPGAAQVAREATAAPVPSAKAAAATPSVAFKTAEISRGAFYATGIAAPGTHVRIYLNGSRLADVTADAEGHWSLTIRKGMTPGHYAVRADALDGGGKVIARAEVPFDVPLGAVEAKLDKAVPAVVPSSVARVPADQAAKPSRVAEDENPAPAPEAPPAAPKPADLAKTQTAAAPAQPTPSSAVVSEISTATVERGDSLWRISRKAFGRGIRYTLIYAANASQIRDPNLIYPHQVFVLPRLDP